jgi:hypothetical protein
VSVVDLLRIDPFRGVLAVALLAVPLVALGLMTRMILRLSRLARDWSGMWLMGFAAGATIGIIINAAAGVGPHWFPWLLPPVYFVTFSIYGWLARRKLRTVGEGRWVQTKQILDQLTQPAGTVDGDA